MERLEAIGFMRETYDMLLHQHDLTPNNPIITAGLQNLVNRLHYWQETGFGNDLYDEPALADLRTGLPHLCGIAECEMEKWWARRIIADPCPAARTLALFWYLDNYCNLCKAESDLVERQHLTDLAFLGCGALPISALFFAEKNPETLIRCVDHDGEACELAADLVAAVGLSARIEIIEDKAEQFPVSSSETVICASLLLAPGLDEHIRTRGVQRLLLRDVEGVYRWLYMPARAPGAEFRERARTPISSTRINTTRYFVAGAV